MEQNPKEEEAVSYESRTQEAISLMQAHCILIWIKIELNLNLNWIDALPIDTKDSWFCSKCKAQWIYLV